MVKKKKKKDIKTNLKELGGNLIEMAVDAVFEIFETSKGLEDEEEESEDEEDEE